jgi:hypothetical protein
MIKTTIIIILILLLLITLYSYYCLSSRMVNFERARLEYILQKESDVKTKESKVKVVADCSNKNIQYLSALENINKILGGLNIESENSTNDLNEKNNNIIKGVQNVIMGKINPDIVAGPESIQSCSTTHNKHNKKYNNKHNDNDVDTLINQESIDVEMLSEVPSEYIE